MYIYINLYRVITMQKSEIIHYPNLSTMLEVEKVLKEADGTISKEELKRRLPTKIMHQTLNLILAYMENRGLILSGPERKTSDKKTHPQTAKNGKKRKKEVLKNKKKYQSHTKGGSYKEI